MKVALYVRKEKSEEVTKGKIEKLKEYCKENGHEIIGEFSDTKHTQEEVSGLNGLSELYKNGDIEAAVIYSVSEFAMKINQYYDVMEKSNNIPWIALDGQETVTESGKLRFSVGMLDHITES